VSREHFVNFVEKALPENQKEHFKDYKKAIMSMPDHDMETFALMVWAHLVPNSLDGYGDLVIYELKKHLEEQP
jgi:hypothetical protein